MEKYYATENGEIFNKKRNTILKSQNRFGYRQVCLIIDGKRKSVLVHRFILAFFTNKPLDYKMVVNHKNGIKDDNTLNNLEWCIQSQNCKHAYNTGLAKVSLLNKQIVQEIHGKILLDTSNGVFYNSIREAAYYNNIPEGTLRKKILGTRKNNTSFIKI
jgi:GTP-binding protein EngB required for normal cell division